MKKIVFFSACIACMASCTEPTTPDPGNPSTGQYIDFTLNGTHYRSENDSVVNVLSGSTNYTLSTGKFEGKQIELNVKYPVSTGDTTETFAPSGSISLLVRLPVIYRSVNGSATFHKESSTIENVSEIFTGTFNGQLKQILMNDTVNVTGGTYRVHRIL
jgi:hypothetical protein